MNIKINTGDEGPKHDLYLFVEMLVETTDGCKIKTHCGLVNWMEIGDERSHYYNDEDLKLMAKRFEQHVGMSYAQAWRAYDKFHSRCHKCGGTSFDCVDGFPGETLVICTKCKSVCDCHFDESAII